MPTNRNNRSDTTSAVAEVEAFLGSLRPGEAIDLVFQHEAGQPLDVRRVSILEIDPHQGLVVNQPNRKITKTVAAQRLEATVLKHDRQTDKYTRLGFYTTIRSFIDSFQLVDSTQDALLLALPREIHPANLRAAFRQAIPPSLVLPVTVLNESKQTLDIAVEIVNLSTVGALISYRRPAGTQPYLTVEESIFLEVDFSELIERLAVRLYASQAELSRPQIRGRIVRTYEESEMRRSYAAVSFQDLTRPQEDLLHAVILKLQVSMSSRGML
jgi:hypothetical protein